MVKFSSLMMTPAVNSFSGMLWCWLYAACLFGSLVGAENTISVKVQPPWQSKFDPKSLRNLAIQAGEYVWSRSVEAYWRYIEILLHEGCSEDNFKSHVYKVLPESDHLEEYLKYNVYSPILEAFHQVTTTLKTPEIVKTKCSNIFAVVTFMNQKDQTSCMADLDSIISEQFNPKATDSFKEPTTSFSTILPIDHVFAFAGEKPLVFLYYGYEKYDGNADYIKSLFQQAKEGKISLVLRPLVEDLDGDEEPKESLAGFGVEFAASKKEFDGKSTFPFKGLYHLPRTIIKDKDDTITNLDLGLAAVQAIFGSADPAEAFKGIAQNWPLISARVSNLVSLEDEAKALAKKSVTALQELFVPDLDYIFINGMIGRSDSFNLYSLMEASGTFERFHQAVVPTDVKPQQLFLTISEGLEQGQASIRYDLKGVHPDAIVFLNNLATDARYAHWSASSFALMRQATNNQGIYPVKRNLVEAILVFDVAKYPQTLSILLGATIDWAIKGSAGVQSNRKQDGLPIRFGLVLYSSDPALDNVVKCFYGLASVEGLRSAITYIRGWADAISDADDQENINSITAEAVYQQLLKSAEKEDLPRETRSFENLIDDDRTRQRWISARQLSQKFDITDPTIVINGRVTPIVAPSISVLASTFAKTLIAMYREEIRQIQVYLLKRAQESTQGSKSPPTNQALAAIDKELEGGYLEALLKASNKKEKGQKELSLFLKRRRRFIPDDPHRTVAIQIDKMRLEILNSLIDPNCHMAIPQKRSKQVDDSLIVWLVADPLTREGAQAMKECFKYFAGSTSERIRFRWFYPNKGDHGIRMAEYYYKLQMNRVDVKHFSASLDAMIDDAVKGKPKMDPWAGEPGQNEKKERMDKYIQRSYTEQTKVLESVLLDGQAYKGPILFINGVRYYHPDMAKIGETTNVLPLTAVDVENCIRIESHLRTDRHFKRLRESLPKERLVSADMLLRFASAELSLISAIEHGTGAGLSGLFGGSVPSAIFPTSNNLEP